MSTVHIKITKMGENSILVNLFLVHEMLQDEGLDKQEVVAELPEDQPEVIPEASVGRMHVMMSKTL